MKLNNHQTFQQQHFTPKENGGAYLRNSRKKKYVSQGYPEKQTFLYLVKETGKLASLCTNWGTLEETPVGLRWDKLSFRNDSNFNR